MPVLASVSALLDDSETPGSVRPVLEMTRRNVELEARLIDDLLDVTRIVQGKLRLESRPVDAHDPILRALEIAREEIDRKNQSLVLDLSARDSTVQADPARLQQIAWNLIKNASKFTPEGGEIAITSRDEPTENGRPRLVVSVRDSGIGIDPDALPRIFDAFEQADPAIAKRFGGLGLGLAISRTLAEALGGELVAWSEGSGLGAEFTLVLPTISAPSTDASSPALVAPSEPLAPLSILLVEDNPDSLRVMARLLGARGHRVTTASGVAEALARANPDGFDLLISDIGLPDGSGLDIVRQVGRRARLGAIALSGFGMEDDIVRSGEAGFSAHLTKPIDFGTLEAAIRRVVLQNTSIRPPVAEGYSLEDRRAQV